MGAGTVSSFVLTFSFRMNLPVGSIAQTVPFTQASVGELVFASYDQASYSIGVEHFRKPRDICNSGHGHAVKFIPR